MSEEPKDLTDFFEYTKKEAGKAAEVTSETASETELPPENTFQTSNVSDMQPFEDALGDLTNELKENPIPDGTGDISGLPSDMPVHNFEAHDSAPLSAPVPLEPLDTLGHVKNYSETISSVTAAAVPASVPYSLSITGQLAEYEKERLLDILSRENMGFREVDLEPQLAAGKILIPRISEFAGVVLIQALRGTQAKMRLGPSDSIFATEDTRSETIATGNVFSQVSVDQAHEAENLPITTETDLPGVTFLRVIDIVSASTSLKSSVVEAQSSSQYQEVIENLQRELKYKAYRKGATAIINFTITMTNLSMPTHYKILVMGTAVKFNKPATP